MEGYSHTFIDPNLGRREIYNELVLDSCSDARQLINQLKDVLRSYKSVSVADLYDIIGLQCSYKDYMIGWTKLDTAQPALIEDDPLLKNKWTVIFPEPERI